MALCSRRDAAAPYAGSSGSVCTYIQCTCRAHAPVQVRMRCACGAHAPRVPPPSHDGCSRAGPARRARRSRAPPAPRPPPRR
eukprot:scaffold30281_cov63-Phaeocystis_antarctica.AAC.5